MPLAYTPLPHQKQCLRRLNRARRARKRRALIVMASRLGKTVTAAHFARRMIGRTRKKVLFLVHRKDILEQAKATFEAVIGGPKDRFDFFHGKRKRRDGVQFLFASFDAIRNVRKLFDKKEFALVVVDESHHGPAATYRPTIDYFEPEFCLAMTATPDRMDLQSIREIFGEEVFSLPIEMAIPQGLLCDAEYIVLTDEIVEQRLSGGRELTSEDGSKLKLLDLNRLFGIAKRDRKVVELIEAEIAKHQVKNPRLIVFCPSVAYANWLASFMPNSAPIHSKLPTKVRDDRMAAFRSGTLRAALVVDQFNEGVDIPDANVAVFLRSTVSWPMFLQQLARVLTKLPGKTKALVLDLVGNCERLEMVDALRQSVGRKRQTKGPQALTAVNVRFQVNFTRATRRVLRAGSHDPEPLQSGSDDCRLEGVGHSSWTNTRATRHQGGQSRASVPAPVPTIASLARFRRHKPPRAFRPLLSRAAHRGFEGVGRGPRTNSVVNRYRRCKSQGAMR